MCIIKRHFRWVRADSGGTFFHEIQWPVRGVPAFRGKRFFTQYGGPSGGSQQSGGKRFFAKYSGPSSGSLLSGGGIIIFRVIRRHFLTAAVDPAVSLSTTVLFRWKSFLDHVDHAAPRAPGRWSGQRRGLGRVRRRAREDAAVQARAERSTRVYWFGCGVRLPSPQNNRGVGE